MTKKQPAESVYNASSSLSTRKFMKIGLVKLGLRLETKSSKKISTVRKMPETEWFQTFGIIESQTVWGTI